MQPTQVYRKSNEGHCFRSEHHPRQVNPGPHTREGEPDKPFGQGHGRTKGGAVRHNVRDHPVDAGQGREAGHNLRGAMGIDEG